MLDIFSFTNIKDKYLYSATYHGTVCYKTYTIPLPIPPTAPAGTFVVFVDTNYSCWYNFTTNSFNQATLQFNAFIPIHYCVLWAS